MINTVVTRSNFRHLAQSAVQADESERAQRITALDASIDQLQRIGAAADNGHARDID